MKGLKLASRYLVVFVAVLGLAVAGCSSGSSSSAPAAAGGSGTPPAGSDPLEVADRVSVVDAQSASESGSSVTLARSGAAIVQTKVSGLAQSSVPDGSDYFTEEYGYYVHEQTNDTFNFISEILCWMNETRYHDSSLLNAGNYLAQIDPSVCEKEMDDVSGGNPQGQNSSESNQIQYADWIVNSSREDGQPQIVKVWAQEEGESYEGGEDPDLDIHFKLTIYNSKEEKPPFGIFRSDWTMYEQGTTTVIGTGYMKTEEDASGKILLKFASDEDMGEEIFNERATLEQTGEGEDAERMGTVYNYEEGPWMDGGAEEATFNIHAGTNHFMRKDVDEDETACLDRNDFDHAVWRYGLFDATTGDKVTVSSGFPIKFGEGDDQGHGFIGYHGMWTPGDISLENGATITKENFGSDDATEETYTVFIAGGKLRKHVKQELTLDEIKNIPLSCDSYNESTGQYSYNRVMWDGDNFVTDATQGSDWQWEELEGGAISYDLSDLRWTNLNFYSNALGGQGRVIFAEGDCTQNSAVGDAMPTYDCSSPTESTALVIFHREDLVYPGDATVPTALSCLENCPNPTTMNDDDESTQDSYNTWNSHWQEVAPGSATFQAYTFDPTNYTLTDDTSSSLVVKTATDVSWGYSSGPLFDITDAAVVTALTCPDFDDDDATVETCGWQAMGLETFYTWETGPENWSKFTGVKDAQDNFVTFDPPKQVKYTHIYTGTDVDSPDYQYNGSTFYLEYGGFGDLWGLPSICIDPATQEEIECGDSGEVRMVPEINIPWDAAKGDSSLETYDSTYEPSTVIDAESGDTYIVKHLQGEQRMTPVDVSNCADLSVDTSYALPSLDDWIDPELGDKPTITSPSVIGGCILATEECDIVSE